MFSYNSNYNAQVYKKNSLFRNCSKAPLLPLSPIYKNQQFQKYFHTFFHKNAQWFTQNVKAISVGSFS